MEHIDEIKILIRENNLEDSYFTDSEIRFYFKKNNQDIEATAYELLLIKAEDDSVSLPSGIKLTNNENYWLRLAQKYRPNGSRTL